MYSTKENFYDSLESTRKSGDMSSASDNYGVQSENVSGDYRFRQNMQQLKEDIDRSQDFINMLGNKPAREKYYQQGFRDYLVPENNELRRRRNFVFSQNTINNALDDYYSDTVHPQYTSAKNEAEKRGEADYMNYMSIPGMNQRMAMGAMQRATDPAKIAQQTISGLDNEALDSVAGPYARYARLSPDDYRDTVLKPALHNRLMDDVIDENTPKNSLEYIGRRAYDNSLVGKMMDFSQSAYSGTHGWRHLNDAALENYGANRLEDFAANVGALAGDSFLFYGIGGAASKIAGGATSLVRNKLANNILSKGVAKGITADAAHNMARKYIVDNIGARIAQSSMTQALTLGTYDAANSVYNDLVHGDDVNISSAASSFAHGAGTGTLLGVVGTPLRALSKSLTGAKRMAASAGVLSAESAVFTLGTELEKASSGIEIEPIDLLQDFGESTATLLAMRMLHWRPSGGVEKLNSMGRLKQELRFTPAEAHEIADTGVNPSIFLNAVESSLKNGNSADIVKNDYLRMMSDGDLSASTRAKLLYIVENKLTSTPPLPVGYTVRKLTDGGYMATTYNMNGGRIENKIFPDRNELDTYINSSRSDIKRNLITGYENMIAQSYDSQSFFRQAGIYAKERGVDVGVISEAMYKKANKEPLSSSENAIIDEIFQRSGYASDKLANILNDMRAAVEQSHRLESGGLMAALDKPYYRQSKSEVEAIRDYELLLRDEARALLGKPMQEASSSVVSFTQASSPRTYNHTPSRQHELQSEVNRLSRDLGVDFNIIYSDSEILRDHPEYDNIVRASGWFDARNNTLNINLSKFSDVDNIRDTVIHETVGHYGLQKVFGRYYIDFLNEVYERAGEDVKARIDRIGKENNYDVYRAVDEYMARLAEQGARTVEQRSLLSRFKYFVKDMLNRMNIFRNNGGEISERKLNDIIERHYMAMRRGRNPERYRSDVFGGFETANYNKGNNMFDYYSDASSASGRYHVDELGTRNNFYNSNRYRFIGEKGMKNMLSKGDSYLSDKLDEAKNLFRHFADARYIKYKTGWEVGADGDWRFEIDDNIIIKDYLKNLIKFTDDRFYDSYVNIKSKHPSERTELEKRLFEHILYKRYPLDDAARLQDIIKDNMFFSAYPELADMPVRFEKMNGPLCLYNAPTGEIKVDMRAFSEPSFAKELVVQLQRIIQDYEDFSRGYDMDRIEDLTTYKFDDANSLRGNVELRNVARRYDWNKTKRMITPAKFSEDYPRSMQRPSLNVKDLIQPWNGPVDILYGVLKYFEGTGNIVPPRQVTHPTPMQKLEQEYFYNDLEKKAYRNYYKSLNGKNKKSSDMNN